MSATLRQRTAASAPSAPKAAAPAKNGKREISEVFTPPSFTVKDLLSAIPKHCFERSALKSGAYLAGDLAMLSVCVFLASYIDSSFGKNGAFIDGFVGRIARVAAWCAYFFCAGTVGTGVWIIGHECGHQAFSPSKTINNTVGWFAHSALLVPYHSWRISHASHHASTGSMEKDHVFVPRTRSSLGIKPESEIIADAVKAKNEETFLQKVDEVMEDTPIRNIIRILIQQLFGWPAYLINNATGQKYGRQVNHFDPNSPLFDKRHFYQILLSDLGLGITITALTIWGMNRSLAEVAKFYIVPWFVVHHHLVLITYLQHTDVDLPHYRKAEWNFQRGAICTIDRSLYGPIGGFLMHGICETHVAHHICSKIPHYNAWEAAAALRGVLGDHYMQSDENMYISLYKTYQQCKYVEDEGSCVFYKNKDGKAKRRVVYESDSGVDVKDVQKESDEDSS